MTGVCYNTLSKELVSNIADIHNLDTKEKKRDAEEDEKVRPEVLHLHGTDNMSTEDVFKHLAAYSPAQLEWVNDSSCMSFLYALIAPSYIHSFVAENETRLIL